MRIPSAATERNVICYADTALSSCPDTLRHNIFCSNTVDGCTLKALNLEADPLFCQKREGTGEYTLRWDSPVVAANNSWNVQVLDTPVECAWGELARNTTVAAGDTVTILEDVIVPWLRTLTLQPGVTLRFDADDESKAGFDTTLNELHVGGTLIAGASAGPGITFTSAAATPSTGDWGGLSAGIALVTLKNALIEYADTQKHP